MKKLNILAIVFIAFVLVGYGLFLSFVPSNFVAHASPTLAMDGTPQTASITNSPGPLIIPTLTTTNSNDLIYVSVCGSQSFSGVASIVSSPSLAWNQRRSVQVVSGGYLETWYAIKPSSGSVDIGIYWASTGAYVVAEAFAISGAETVLSPFDTVNSTSGSGSPASVSITTTNANDFILGAVGQASSPIQTLIPVSPFTAVITPYPSNTYAETSAEYKVYSSTQSGLKVNFTIGGSNSWGMIADAVKKSTTSSIGLSPPSGPLGQSVTVTGSNFIPSSNIALSFNTLLVSTSPGTVTVNASGDFSCSFTVPTWANVGSNTVQASDGTNTATAAFTVPSALQLDSSTSSRKIANTASGSTLTLATFSTASTNDVIYACGYVPATGHTLSISDTAGLTWIPRGSVTSNGQQMQSWYAIATSTISSKIITLTNSPAGAMAFMAFAVSGANTASPFDPNLGNPVSASSGSSAIRSTVSITTTNPTDMIVGLVGMPGSTGTITSGLPVFTATFASTVSNPGGAGEYKIVSTTQNSLNVTFSWTSATNWLMMADALVANTGKITVASSPTGSGFVTVDGTPITTPQTYNWVTGSTHTLAAQSPVSGGTGIQYIYNGWSDTGTQSHTYTVPSSTQTVTANFKTQYNVTFAQSGLDSSTASGTVLTVNVTNVGYSSFSYSVWVNSSDSLVYSYNSTVSSSTAGKQFVLGTVSPSSPLTVTVAQTVTGTYKTQWQVFFGQSGLDGTATGTVVTVNSTGTAYSGLPYSVWANSSDVLNFTYGGTAGSSAAGKQFILAGANASSPLTVTAATTVTGTYKTQYNVTFAQSGLNSDASGTIVTVNGTAKTYVLLPNSTWVDSGSSMNFNYATTVSSTSGKQYVLTGVNASSPLSSISQAILVVGTYKTQYNVTFGQSGVSSDFTGTVVTVNGTTYDRAGTSFWANASDVYSFSYASPLTVNSGKQYVFVSANSSSPLTVSAATTVTGTYKTQYNVTFGQSGVGSDFSGTVVTINSTLNYDRNGVSFWADANSPQSFVYGSSLTVSAGKQYVLTGANASSPLPVTAATTVTGTYKTRYNVTFAQSGVGVDFSGDVVKIDGTNYTRVGTSFWWDDTSSHSFAFYSPLVVTANGKQYVWDNTTGLSSAQTDASFVVSTSGSVTGNYKTQYYLTVNSAHGTPGGGDWYDSGHTAYATVTPLTVAGPTGTQYVFTGWTGDASGSGSPSDNILMAGPKTATATWKTQYYLTVETGGHGSAGGQNWYDANTNAQATIAPLTVAGSTGTQYVFTGWTGDASGSGSPSNNINMTGPETATGTWKTQYQLTVTSAYGSTTGAGWYDGGATPTAGVSVGSVDHGNGTQHVFTSWGTDASGTVYSASNPITMNAPKTATANWQTQYLVTYSATGNVLSVTVPSDEWVDSGGGATGVFPSQVTDTGTRCNFVSDNRTSITEPTLIVGTYQTQYEVTFDVSPGGSGTTTPSVSDWFDAGSSGNAISASANSGYEFGSWSKTGSITIADSSLNSTTITVDGPGTVTANFNVAVASTSLTVQCSPTTVDKSGSHITTISGYLTSGGSGVAGKTVELYYQYGASGPTGTPSDGNWTGLASVTTGSNGSYSVPWDPDESMSNGYYWIKASFAGAGGYSGSEATTGVDVAHNLLVVPVMPLGTLMAALSMIVVLGAYGGLRRRKNRTSKQ